MARAFFKIRNTYINEEPQINKVKETLDKLLKTFKTFKTFVPYSTGSQNNTKLKNIISKLLNSLINPFWNILYGLLTFLTNPKL